jgi:glycosyltransferase involved in cell wall biosynthesis
VGTDLHKLKIAIVHPWFLMNDSEEKFIDVLAGMYPNADIFALFADARNLSSQLRNRNIHASILNRFPFTFRFHRQLLPLYPLAMESMDLTQYDLIISSGGPSVMGINPRQDAIHIYYCHTPQRCWWDLYPEHQAQMPPLIRHIYVLASSYVRNWEYAAVQRVDHVISNSHYIRHRVFKYFRRYSTVIYPPVDTSIGYLGTGCDEYYLSVARLEKDKRIDLLIHACNSLGRKLVVVGSGKEEQRLKSIAGPTIVFPGLVSEADLRKIYANCRAFLFAADEDFATASVEAQAFGRPVIAYGHGGSLETVRVEDPYGRPDTGLFFYEQTEESVIEGIRQFEAVQDKFTPAEIQQHARQFDTTAFVHNMQEFVDEAMERRMELQ